MRDLRVTARDARWAASRSWNTARGGDTIQIGNVLLLFSEADEPGTIVHCLPTPAAATATSAGDDGRRLALLYEVSRAISDLGETAALLGRMLEAILNVLGAERAVIVLADGTSGVRRRFERAQALQGAR